jgi:molecular chaperone GrpE
MTAPEDMGTGPVIRDHRRIDPVTGQPKRGKHAATGSAGTNSAGRPGGAGGAGGVGPGAGAGGDRPGAAKHGKSDDTGQEAKQTDLAELDAAKAAAESARAEMTERTADLQRLQAEYANYRKRVDRDRAVVREQAVAASLNELLPVLDAIGQAREHGELSGGFKSVADSLQAAVGKLGLVSYGQRGDPFDPNIHEALMHSYSPDVTEDTCVEVLQPGYKVGERILRPARVAVAEPATGPDGSANAAEWSPGEEEAN